MTIHGAGFSAKSGGGNNDKTTVAGKGILLAMCHTHIVVCVNLFRQVLSDGGAERKYRQV